ncbi:MAG: HAD-IB family hydrolase [Steroidobacteraceae bacterium]
MGEPTLAVFDLDGTITRHDTLTPLLSAFLLRHPWRLLRMPLALPAILPYLIGRGDRGALKGAMTHAVLGGLTRAELDRYVDTRLPALLRAGLFAEAVERIAWHRTQQHRLLLMSASTDFYVPRIAAALGFDDCICTPVRWRSDGCLDGRLASANRRGPEKTRCLRDFLKSYAAAQIFAYGNSPADLDHMQLASEGWYVNGHATDIPADAPQIRAVRWQRRGGV